MLKNLFLILTLLSLNIAFAILDAEDGEWVTVSGKVTLATGDYFILNKGSESVTVEMDDWDWYKEGYKILKGDDVIVHGRVDHDFLENKKIEAGSVFVKGLNTFYYASSDDEEPEPQISSFFWRLNDIPDGVVMEMTGVVDSISGRTFMLNTGYRKVKIDTSTLPYNPLDSIGLFTLTKGDKVKVSGRVEENWFSKDEVDANWLVILKNN